ncbi:MAG: hypothetical protein GXN92_03390 [Candidatus Micrarchaeota archaeon]|nr:hypothetical protein [Candidatus Micrarchaeota archaeon]
MAHKLRISWSVHGKDGRRRTYGIEVRTPESLKELKGSGWLEELTTAAINADERKFRKIVSILPADDRHTLVGGALALADYLLFQKLVHKAKDPQIREGVEELKKTYLAFLNNLLENPPDIMPYKKLPVPAWRKCWAIRGVGEVITAKNYYIPYERIKYYLKLTVKMKSLLEPLSKGHIPVGIIDEFMKFREYIYEKAKEHPVYAAQVVAAMLGLFPKLERRIMPMVYPVHNIGVLPTGDNKWRLNEPNAELATYFYNLAQEASLGTTPIPNEWSKLLEPAKKLRFLYQGDPLNPSPSYVYLREPNTKKAV